MRNLRSLLPDTEELGVRIVSGVIVAMIPFLVTSLMSIKLFGQSAWLLGLGSGVACLVSSLSVRNIPTMPVWWTAAGIGVAMGIRLDGADEATGAWHVAGWAALLVLLGLTFAVAARTAEALQKRRNNATMLRWAGVLLLGSVVVRGILPPLTSLVFGKSPDGWNKIDLLKFDTMNGRIWLLSKTIQGGELTFLAVLIGIALLIQALTTNAGTTVRETYRAMPLLEKKWVRISVLSGVAYFALGLLDLGPLVLTVIGATTTIVMMLGVPALNTFRRRILLLLVAGVVVAIAGLIVAIPSMPAHDRIVSWMGGDTAQVATTMGPPNTCWAAPSVDQVHQGQLAVTAAGVLGRGLGSNPLVPTIPEARGDMVVASLMGDFGIAAIIALVCLLLLAYSATLSQLRGRDPVTASAAGLALSAAFGLVWSVGASVGVLPLSGISARWLCASGSSLLSTVLAIGWVMGARSSRQDTPTTVLSLLAKGMAIFVATSFLAFAITAQPTRVAQVLPSSADRGNILARDGTVLAYGTGAISDDKTSVARSYPQGGLYASAVGRLWAVAEDRTPASSSTESAQDDQTSSTCAAPPPGRADGLEASAVGLMVCGPDNPGVHVNDAFRPQQCQPASIVTALNTPWQQAASEALTGQSGAVEVIDSQTGEILVEYSTGQENYYSVTHQSELPRSFADDLTAPLGSMMAPFSAAATVTAGVDFSSAPTNTYESDGQSITNPDGSLCFAASLEAAMSPSCHSVMAWAAAQLPNKHLQRYLQSSFGFDTGLGTSSGLAGLQRPSRMQIALAGSGVGDASGHPKALAIALAALVSSANGSTLRTPHLVVGTCSSGTVVPYDQGNLGLSMVDTEVATQILSILSTAGARGENDSQALRDALTKDGQPEAPIMAAAIQRISESGFPVDETAWSAAVLQGRYVVVAQVRNAPIDGVNRASVAIAAMLPALAVPPSEPKCGS